LFIKDFADMRNLYMLGVMDGHGVFGHTVSQFVKLNLPIILAGLTKGASKHEMSLMAGRI
jgi:serine/threonine protein phosphatase PrpC